MRSLAAKIAKTFPRTIRLRGLAVMQRQSSTPPPAILETLHAEHETIKSGFRRYERELARAKYWPRALFSHTPGEEPARRALEDLAAHMRFEEGVFYPCLESTESGAVLATCRKEHEGFKGLVDYLRELDPGDPEFDGTFRLLAEVVENHMKSEEALLFPLAEAALRNTVCVSSPTLKPEALAVHRHRPA